VGYYLTKMLITAVLGPFHANPKREKTMKRNLLISLLAVALGTGTAVASEGHDHSGGHGHGHESGASDAPETEAFYPGKAGEEGEAGGEPSDHDRHAHRHADEHGHDH
jgi:hypothetical protein